MDEAIGDEVAEPVGGTHIQNKENEFSLKPGSSNMMQSNEMVTPGVDDYHDNSNSLYSDILYAKNQDRIGSSEHASASPRCMDEAGVMVEELTLRNYDGEKLTIVGTSSNRERMQTRQNPWQHLYQIARGSGISNLHGQTGYKGKGQASSSACEDGDFFSGLLDQNQPLPNHNHAAMMENLLSNEDKGTSGDILYSSGGIRTKILSKSGFSEYFIKSSLRGKGTIHKSPGCRGSGTEPVDQDHPESGIAGSTNSAAPLGLTAKPVSPLSDGVSEPWNTVGSKIIGDGTSLREWLETGGKKANRVEKMRIFRQVLDLVDFSHSRGLPLQDLRPSCFKLSASYQVMYLGPSVRASITEKVADYNRNEKRPMHQGMLPMDNHSVRKRKLGENMNFVQRWPQFPSRSGVRSASANVASVNGADFLDPSNDAYEEHNPKTEIKNHNRLLGRNVPNSPQRLQASVSSMLEEKWYTSPELFDEKACSLASNIYCLGVLLFELLGSFDSGRSHAAAMHDLRHRILPPSFLSENPKEAGFCLWLLHPEPSLRPTTREIMQSDFICGIQELSGGGGELSGGELLSSIDEEDAESELLLHFLSLLSEQKQKDASNLVEQIQRIEADIQEVEKRRPKKSHVLSSSPQESLSAYGSRYTHGGNASLDAFSKMSERETRLMSNIRQLENAYFSMRANVQLKGSDVATHRDGDLLKSRGNWCSLGEEDNTADHLGGFFDGLCKYARYSKFKVRGIMRNGEFNNSANVICSLSFDRDEDYLAAGGVSKKIKIFEFQSLFNDSVDIHYPVVEMSNKSRLSCICWNS
ncbi:eIF-2alpha kinase PEK/EIF2AK3 [Handroanthus impetiginosus]|uniref:eIF-2alpha kinase PEK/EIF2AK3 n=1 Tax=Handroanthus impetiginosus TaxID=429701 RepID=A0A2G9I1J7_9LAMI|nr:eIF-2alpha kinase PEK/EIF2AK3 [Handroanthus impetiginosus]